MWNWENTCCRISMMSEVQPRVRCYACGHRTVWLRVAPRTAPAQTRRVTTTEWMTIGGYEFPPGTYEIRRIETGMVEGASA